MFNIFSDSLFNPKGLVKYVKRSGFFVAFYIFILVIFMSLGGIFNVIHSETSVINESSVGCILNGNNLSCQEDNYDIDNEFYIYGYRVLFVEPGTNIPSISDNDNMSIAFDGEKIFIYSDSVISNSITLPQDNNAALSFNQVVSMIKIGLFIGDTFRVLLNSIMSIIFFIFISSLTFLRYRKEIKYSLIFKLVAFAVTPVAIVFTLYSLITFDIIIFYVLLFLAYRSIFVLNKEIFKQVELRKIHGEDAINSEEKSKDESKDDLE